jgi:AraC-type transcriptional regulator N-terminus
MMSKQTGPYMSDGTTIRALARAIGSLVQTDGDHSTRIPALTLHRRSGPTEPLHCIYNLGLGVVAQGEKQVLLGEESIDYGPGQSMLTTIDLPVVSHVTRASGAEPFLGMMLTLDVRSIVQMASEMDESRPRREEASRSISFELLDADLLEALLRLVKLLGHPALIPGLAPLIQQEVILRLLTGPHGPQLRRLVTAGSPSREPRRGQCRRARRVRKPVAIQSRVQSPVRRAAAA